MTEKRFTLKTTQFDGTLSFYDAECDCETRMSTEYVLNKVEITLNTLHEENQHLQQQITDLDIRIEKLLVRNKELKKEREDLKQALIKCAFDNK